MNKVNKHNQDREFEFTDKDFKFLATLVGEKTGIVLSDHKKNMVYSRLTRRLRNLQIESFKEYCTFLEGDKGSSEICDFVNAVTTNLTKFFREKHHFEHLQEQVFAEMIDNPPPGKRVRIWSAGCSAGMEPYSIALSAHEKFSSIQDWDFKILATDIDTNMLDKGRSGIYKSKDIEALSKGQKAKYTSRQGKKESGEIEMSDKLKKLIAFKQLNLLDKWPMKSKFDIIFCRNVVIYFNKETKRKLFDRYADILKPDGWLYIGHSENLHKVSDRFDLIGKTIYRRIK